MKRTTFRPSYSKFGYYFYNDRIYEGAPYNLPDERSLQAARESLQLARAASDGDLVITLVSGGGSALLPLPLDGISLEDKTKVVFYF